MVVGDFAVELDTVVVGAGPGGYVAAIRAAQLGQKVAIIEREWIGGVCLNVGCIPSKALISAGHHYQEALDSSVFGITTENVKLDFSKTQEWKDNKVVKTLTSGVEYLLKKNKVEIIRGNAFFNDGETLRVFTEDAAQTYTFKNAIIATGSRPIEIKGFKFGGRVIDSTGGLNLTEVPKKLVIVGGGVIGTELGGAYANLGAEVTILEGSPQILPTFEKDMVKFVEKSFQEKGVTVVTKAMAKEAIDNGDSVTVKYEANGKEEVIEADYVMVTVGRRPNTDDLGLEVVGVEMTDRGLVKVDNQGRTNVKHIFAIGDIAYMETPKYPQAHPQVANVAINQGKNLGRNFLRKSENEWKEYEYNDQGSMATIGKHRAVVDLPNFKFQGFLAWYFWMFLHLMLILSVRNKIAIFFNWMWSYLNKDSSLRLIIIPNKKNDTEQ